MAQFLFSFLTTSIIMSIIILGIMATIMILPRKFPPRLRYMVWVVVLFGLVIPIRPLFGNGLLTVDLPPILSTFGQDVNNVSITTPQPSLDFTQGISYTPSIATIQSVTLVSIIAITWVLVALIVFLFYIYKYAIFLRLIKRWGVAVDDIKTLSIFDRVLAEKGIKRSIGLKKCTFVSTSMLIGFLYPVILLPNKEYDQDELELIFRHELIHYKRADLYIKLLSVIATSLHWFNPIIYLMSYLMQADCEASCDEKVLLEAGNENNQFYAELIMDMIGSSKSKGTHLSTCFYGGKRGIKIRMEAIMNGTVSITKVSLSSLLVLFLTLTILSGSVFAFSSYTPQEFVNTNSGNYNLQITALQAREIALEKVSGGFLSGLFYDHILEVFRIEVLQGGYRFYLGVDATTGNAIIYRLEEVAMQNITWSQAMDIALGTAEDSTLVFGSMEIIDDFQIFMFHIESNGRNYEIIVGPVGEVLINQYIE